MLLYSIGVLKRHLRQKIIVNIGREEKSRLEKSNNHHLAGSGQCQPGEDCAGQLLWEEPGGEEGGARHLRYTFWK